MALQQADISKVRASVLAAWQQSHDSVGQGPQQD